MSPNKTYLSTYAYRIFSLLELGYKVAHHYSRPIKEQFVRTFSILLYTNRLPFRILPNILKLFLIYVGTVDEWFHIFLRVKHNKNLFILRQRSKKKLYNFWSIYYRDVKRYFYELNIWVAYNNEISNFFFLTRVWKPNEKKLYDSGKLKYNKLTHIAYKNILYYYLNKTALANYPYTYWAYLYPYERFGADPYSSPYSHHMRAYLFVLFFWKLKRASLKNKKKSFVRMSIDSNAGLARHFQFFYKKTKLIITKKKKLKKDLIRTPVKIKIKAKSINMLQKTIKFLVNTKVLTFSETWYTLSARYINLNYKKPEILYKSVQKQKQSLVNLPLMWYTKILSAHTTRNANKMLLFLRATKQFNKGRYSRNRQLYRTGVYWCIWLNIILVYGLYFYFYRFTFSFGYFWLPGIIFILSVFGNRLYKYRFYQIPTLVNEFLEFTKYVYVLSFKLSLYYYEGLCVVVKNKLQFFINFWFLLNKYINSKKQATKKFFKRIFSIK